jgi:CRP/FNR family transcriptional regulator
MGQATGIVGKGALAFAGNNYRSVELFVMNRKIRSIFTCIVKGLARAYYITPKGEDKTAWYIKENEFITDYPAFLNGIQSCYIFETMTPTTVVFLPKKAIYASYPKDWANQKYGRLVAEQIIQILQKRMESFLFQSPKERYLLFMEDNKDLINKISIKDIASLIGIERQSLTRLRKQLLSEK